MCSASLAVTSETSLTPERSDGRAVTQHLQLIEKSGCIINVFACAVQSSRVNNERTCASLQLEGKQLPVRVMQYFVGSTKS